MSPKLIKPTEAFADHIRDNRPAYYLLVHILEEPNDVFIYFLGLADSIVPQGNKPDGYFVV